ncbi:tetratricopeptide repeat protein (macronuclear) [Tetrahymena thermophila SB210]|uniref:Tetratricopeptide repeat protein n=1 Tax=Tetrahymena thermophila (strain SB210) TaxID=312017 RepID=I7MKW2_TETTS|nr:tetratricopeptide repeat protein [Tetrahymena thermophila SB210]EAS00425.1 tetratricopeptide repeat protein [Tetrahymena thermophila SB210]|eukprot:XP_001020670.1 tetratricopeptide repeat protein [Tetrahymena thermophila SB210]
MESSSKQIQDILSKISLEIINENDFLGQNVQTPIYIAQDKFAGKKYEVLIVQDSCDSQNVYNQFFSKVFQQQLINRHIELVPKIVKHIQENNILVCQFEYPGIPLQQFAQENPLFFERVIQIIQQFTFSFCELLKLGFYFSFYDFSNIRVRNDHSIYLSPFNLQNQNDASLELKKEIYQNFIQGIIDILERQNIDTVDTNILQLDIICYLKQINLQIQSTQYDFQSTLQSIQNGLNIYVAKKSKDIMREIELLRTKGEFNRMALLQQILIQIDPCDFFMQYEMGITYKKLNKIDLALRHLKKSVELNSSFDQAYVEIGTIHLYEFMDIDQAQQYFQLAIENNSLNADAYFNLGYCYLNKGQSDQSIPLYKKCLEINDKHAQALLDLGWQSYLLGNIEQALDYYAKSFDADKTIDSTLLNTINCLYILKRQQETKYFIELISSLDGLLKYTQRLIVLDPLNSFLYHDLGIIYLLTGENNKAKISFKKCLEVKPDYLYKDFLKEMIENIQNSF